MKKRFLAIIPARSGSKGLKNKNILNFCKKPLIYWTIRAAQNCKLLDEVVVSTDSKKIKSIAEKFDAKVPFLRPKRISQDNSPSYSLVKHCIDFFKKKKIYFDFIVLLEPTSPIRKKNDIENSIKKFLENKLDSLISLGKVFEHPYVIKKISGNKALNFLNTKNKYVNRQTLPDLYFPYGVIYISKTDSYLKNKTFYYKKTGYYLLEDYQNLEIDNIYDFYSAEAIFKKLKLDYTL
jgi:CMP-N-acetylneuraminic acid synthetase